MAVLSVENLAKSYGDRTLFSDVTFGLTRDDRVGLIGVNGSGKSTLLRVLLGEEEADGGRIARETGSRIEYLAQEPDLDPAKTALETVLADGPRAFEVVKDYEEACQRLSETPDDPELIERVTELSEKMDAVDGWDVETEAKTILSKVGMGETTKPIDAMSGGQRKRVALARALVRPSDLLIMDEPTNHLDVDTVAWIEDYLSGRATGLLVITHDRYFLNRVTNVIFELADQTIYRHEGNYSDFVEARQERRRRRRKQEQKRKKLAKKELEWLRRGPKARGTKAKARKKRAKDLQEKKYDLDDQSVEIDTVERRLGKKIINVEGVSKSRDRRCVIDNFTYRVDRDERLGIIGPNGAGKSTLLDIIAGRLSPDDGDVEHGKTVAIGYYDQQTEDLDPDVRVHDYITEEAHRVPTSDGWMTATQMLDLFLFDKQKQWTYIEKLSGGERRRLYLLRILMQQPNVLLLDEPTNDLDVDTLTVFEDYLDDFEGAVITVSHDRYFLDRTVDHLLAFDGKGGIERIPGNYSHYEELREKQRKEERQKRRRQREREEEQRRDEESSAESAGLSYREEQELQQLEERIDELEVRLQEIDEEFVEQATNFEAVSQLEEEKAEVEQELEESMERWMGLSERA